MRRKMPWSLRGMNALTLTLSRRAREWGRALLLTGEGLGLRGKTGGQARAHSALVCGNSQNLLLALISTLVMLGGGPAANAQEAEQKKKIEPLFSEPFCCGELKNWIHWQGEFPLNLAIRSGSLSWWNTLDFESTGGVATGPFKTENYEVRIEMIKSPLRRNAICVSARSATGEEAYRGYRVRIEGEKVWLEKHNGEGNWKQGELQTGPFKIEADRYHCLRLQVFGSKPVKVSAKIWPQSQQEPEERQLNLLDAGDSPIQSGPLGVGLWYSVAGEWPEPYNSTDVLSVWPLEEDW